MERLHKRLLIGVCAVGLMVHPGPPADAVTVRLAIGAIAGKSAKVRNMEVTLRTHQPHGLSISAEIRQATTHAAGTFTHLRAFCESGNWISSSLSCEQVLASMQHAQVGPIHAEMDSIAIDGLGESATKWTFRAVRVADAGDLFKRLIGLPTFDINLLSYGINLSYRERSLSMLEPVLFNAWGGTIRMDNMRAKWPPSNLATVSTDLTIHNIDLARLTDAFAFGKIEGRLNGTVRDLLLENGQIERFDASFESASDAHGPQTISQRAIDNLTQLSGGGATRTLSRSIAGIFREFSYSKLGLRCRLLNGVCAMDGIAPMPMGYLIVKRGMIPPWIDVIGYNRLVDWRDFLQRAHAALASHGPVLE